MFNDKYGLTDAVLRGRKTQTRRIMPEKIYKDWLGKAPLIDWAFLNLSKYTIGEEIAIAQPYKDVITTNVSEFENLPGWNNKMFISPKLMPNRIKITNIRVEKLQDISDEDVIKEGFCHECVNNNWGNSASHWEYILTYMDKFGREKSIQSSSAQAAYSYLIDHISGVGTWESNPYVFVYDFELIKI